MSGYYPPGVSGSEFEIAGPDFEEDQEMYCQFCDFTSNGLFQRHHARGAWWICYSCDEITELEGGEEPPEWDDE